MTKKILITVAIIIAALVLLLFLAGFIFKIFILKGPDLSQFEYLKNPQINTLPDKKVLQVSFTGSPKGELPKAFGVLFGAYYKMQDVPKGPNMSAPLGRYEIPENLPEDKQERIDYIESMDWSAKLAIPIPENITGLPDVEKTEGFDLEITTWKYGEVAEILYIGPYEDEFDTIVQLENFIKDQGYKIVGDHEEEYIKGPGVFFKGNPNNYHTIIRFRVAKK